MEYYSENVKKKLYKTEYYSILYFIKQRNFMNNEAQMTSTECVAKVLKYLRRSINEYNSAILSRGNANDIAVAETSAKLIDTIANRGVFDSDGCLVTIREKGKTKN